MQQIKAMKRKIGDPWGSGLYMTPLEQKFWEGGGGGVLSEEPSVGGGGLDIFWNHTINLPSEFLLT